MEGLTEAQACWSAGPLGTHVHLGKAGLKVCVLVKGLRNPVTADLIHTLFSWIRVIRGSLHSQKIAEHRGGGQSFIPWSATCKRSP